MSDIRDHEQEPDRPGFAILWGLLALVAVAVLVGGIVAGGALFASRATGLADDGGSSAQSTTQGETLFLPEPSESGTPEQYVTLTDTAVPEPETTVTEEPEPENEISLSSQQTAVGPMDTIDLSGSYPGGDGAVLLVQRLENDVWTDFPVTVPVNGEEFSTFVQTGSPGENSFRVIDTDTGIFSNEVNVRVG